MYMAICADLSTYREIYGPSVLLKMNLAYFLPSIPLLAVSAAVDESLDRRFGALCLHRMLEPLPRGTSPPQHAPPRRVTLPATAHQT